MKPTPPAVLDDEHWMAEAIAQARLAADVGEVPVGAVVVYKDRIVGRGHNRPVADRDPTAHAEIVALRQAAQALGNYRLEGCTLYVTLEPCAMCAQAALHARLERVVYGAKEPRSGAAGSVLDLFALPALNAHTRVQGGILADQAAALMQDFFRRRRAQQRAQAVPLRDDALRTPEAAFVGVWQRAAAWRVTPQDSYACQDLPNLGGLRLHWVEVGPRDGAVPWLCLHGPLAWWPQWGPWLPHRLAQGERCLIPDLIGFGQSDKPKKPAWHSPARHAEILRDWLDALAVHSCRLALAPGAEALWPALQAALGPRVRDVIHVPADDLLPPAADWLDAPFPDRGHRAGPLALAGSAR